MLAEKRAKEQPIKKGQKNSSSENDRDLPGKQK